MKLVGIAISSSIKERMAALAEEANPANSTRAVSFVTFIGILGREV
jgi:hypothetical protein